VNKSSLISTITPIFNGERFIAGLAANLNAQTLQPWQIIVGDNASTDKTNELLKNEFKYQNPVVFIEHKTKKEPHFSWLSLAQCITTEYCLLLPVDDRLQPNYIETADEFLVKNPQTDLLASEGLYTDDFHKLKSLSSSFGQCIIPPVLLSQDQLYDSLLSSSLIPWHFTGLIIRTKLYLDYLSDVSIPVFEGLGDVGLTLCNFNKNVIVAKRASPKIVIFKHQNQESYRLRDKWLPDYFKLARYSLELKNIPSEIHSSIIGLIVKLLIKNYFISLLSASSSKPYVAQLFWSQYPSLIRDCQSKFGISFDNQILPASPLKLLLQKIVLRESLWRILSLIPIKLFEFARCSL